MKYRLNTTNYHDFATFAVNKLPARSYFIPYPGRAAADAVEKLPNKVFETSAK